MIESANLSTKEKNANGRSTLGDLFLHAEHIGSRRIVTREREDSSWQATPGWRFFRQTLRIALYFRERAGLGSGDRVLTLSRLRRERLVVEWASVIQSAVVAPLGPGPSDKVLASALEHLAPSIVFVGDLTDKKRILDLAIGRKVDVIAFDDVTPLAESKAITWSALCDAGGTFDTAERAQQLRGEIRAIKAEVPAVAYPQVGAGGNISWIQVTQAQLAKQIVDFLHRNPAAQGDVAYVVESPSDHGSRLALWALVADGVSSIAMGTPGKEAAEVEELRPQMLVLPREVARTIPTLEAHEAQPGLAHWVGRLPLIRDFAERKGRGHTALPRPRRIVTLDGTY